MGRDLYFCPTSMYYHSLPSVFPGTPHTWGAGSGWEGTLGIGDDCSHQSGGDPWFPCSHTDSQNLRLALPQPPEHFSSFPLIHYLDLLIPVILCLWLCHFSPQKMWCMHFIDTQGFDIPNLSEPCLMLQISSFMNLLMCEMGLIVH